MPIAQCTVVASFAKPFQLKIPVTNPAFRVDPVLLHQFNRYVTITKEKSISLSCHLSAKLDKIMSVHLDSTMLVLI